MEYIVVARQGQDGRGVDQARFRGTPEFERRPVPPEHLYRAGSGQTLCRLRVDETWERFPALAGALSARACAQCQAHAAESTSRPGMD